MTWCTQLLYSDVILTINRKLTFVLYLIFVINKWNLGTRLRVREKRGGEARSLPSFLAHPLCFLRAQYPLSLPFWMPSPRATWSWLRILALYPKSIYYCTRNELLLSHNHPRFSESWAEEKLSINPVYSCWETLSPNSRIWNITP